MSSERSVERHSNRAKPGDVAYENVAIAKYSYATLGYKTPYEVEQEFYQFKYVA